MPGRNFLADPRETFGLALVGCSVTHWPWGLMEGPCVVPAGNLQTKLLSPRLCRRTSIPLLSLLYTGLFCKKFFLQNDLITESKQSVVCSNSLIVLRSTKGMNLPRVTTSSQVQGHKFLLELEQGVKR